MRELHYLKFLPGWAEVIEVVRSKNFGGRLSKASNNIYTFVRINPLGFYSTKEVSRL